MSDSKATRKYLGAVVSTDLYCTGKNHEYQSIYDDKIIHTTPCDCPKCERCDERGRNRKYKCVKCGYFVCRSCYKKHNGEYPDD